MQGVYKDRKETAAETAARRAVAYELMLDKEFKLTLQHLRRYGAKLVPNGKGGTRPRWSATALAAVEQLLRLYFFGPDDEITVREGMNSDKLVAEVRKRFAGACYLNARIKNTPGEAQPWFEEALTRAEAFHERNNPAAKATAEPAQQPESELVNA